MHCIGCNSEIQNEARFCPKCGLSLRPAQKDKLIGQKLDGRYLILEQLGEGGSGKVYLGRHINLGKRVAIKILHHELIQNEKAVNRFRKEALSVSELENSHIIKVFDFGQIENRLIYIAMEFLSGETLAKRLVTRKRLPYNEVVDIIAQICDGLMEAHAMGFIHRDLRPRNIMFTRHDNSDNFVKILDFGMAKICSSDIDPHKSGIGVTLGDPSYTAPEQLRDKKIDARTDIYSLGIMAYHALTGYPPYRGNNLLEIMAEHLDAPYPQIEGLITDLPGGIDHILAKCMAKKPEDRYRTVSQLKSDLTNLIDAPVAPRTGKMKNIDPGMSYLNLERPQGIDGGPSVMRVAGGGVVRVDNQNQSIDLPSEVVDVPSSPKRSFSSGNGGYQPKPRNPDILNNLVDVNSTLKVDYEDITAAKHRLVNPPKKPANYDPTPDDITVVRNVRHQDEEATVIDNRKPLATNPQPATGDIRPRNKDPDSVIPIPVSSNSPAPVNQNRNLKAQGVNDPISVQKKEEEIAPHHVQKKGDVLIGIEKPEVAKATTFELDAITEEEAEKERSLNRNNDYHPSASILGAAPSESFIARQDELIIERNNRIKKERMFWLMIVGGGVILAILLYFGVSKLMNSDSDDMEYKPNSMPPKTSPTKEKNPSKSKKVEKVMTPEKVKPLNPNIPNPNMKNPVIVMKAPVDSVPAMIKTPTKPIVMSTHNSTSTHTKKPKINFKQEMSKARSFMNNGNFSGAYAIYKKLKSSYSSSFSVLMGFASASFELGKTREAEKALSKAVKVRNSARAWYKLGNARRKLGRTSAAKAAYQKALSINPKYGAAKRALQRL